MSFFGRNTAQNAAQFAQNASGYRKDAEARSLQTEIDQVGREVMQALANIKPEDTADAMPKIAQLLKSKNYSERALVAGINLAMGYTKANLTNQQSKAATRTSQAQATTAENQNAAYADEQAVKGALADIQQHPTGIPYSLPEEYNKSRLSQLTPTQQYSALGAQTATKAAVADTALEKKKTLAEIAKLNAEAGAKSTGSTKEKVTQYANNVQAVQNKYGWQKDMNEVVIGNVLQADWPAVQADLKARGINSVTLNGERIDTNGGWPGGKKAAVTIKINPYNTGSEDLTTQSTPAQSSSAPSMSKTQLDQLINSDSMNLPTMGPQNDPTAVTSQTMPTEGKTQGQVQGAQQGRSLLQSSMPSQQQILNPTPGGAQTINPAVFTQPSNEVLTDNASSLGALVKNKTSKTGKVDAYKAKAKQYVKSPEEEALVNKVIDKYRAKQKLEPEELKLLDLLVSMLHEAP